MPKKNLTNHSKHISMARIIAISNQKGGVGKTTSTISIGSGLANLGKRVLLVDLDPQANLTSGLGMKEAEHTIHGAMLGEYKIKPYPVKERLAFVACSAAISSFEKLKGDAVDREFILKETLETIADKCDYILLDCPPSLGLITVNAFVAAQSVYTPLEAQLYSTEGLNKVVDMVNKINKRLNPELLLKGIFFTRYDRRKILKRETQDSIRQSFPELILNSTIRESIALGEAPHLGKDIFSYAPHSAGAIDYGALVEEILERESVTVNNTI
jgi:chromosome partitioning protein